MRTKLIFKGIGETSDKKTWGDTTKELLKTLREVDSEYSHHVIEPCHLCHAKKKSREARGVIAKSFSWKYSDISKHAFTVKKQYKGFTILTSAKNTVH